MRRRAGPAEDEIYTLMNLHQDSTVEKSPASAERAGAGSQDISRARVNLAVIGVALGTFLAALDITIMGTAMPTIVGFLGGLHIYSWAFSSYFLASVVATPIFGKLADMYGIRRVYLIAIGTFVVASALCGMSQNMPMLIVFRGFQGIGGGSLMALSLTVLGVLFPPERLGRTMGIMNAVWGVAAIAGPMIGGILVEKISWRWIFYINLPTGFAAAAFVMSGLARKQETRSRQRPDYPGGVTLLCGIVALLLVAGQGKPKPFGWIDALLLTVGLALLAFFVWNESKAEEPILPLSLFRIRKFAFASLLGFLTGAGFFTATAYVPLFYQGVIGATAIGAGAVLMPMSLGWSISSSFGISFFIGRVSLERLLSLGFVFLFLAYILLSLVSVDSSYMQVAAAMTILGIGMGFIFTMLLTIVQTGVPKVHLGVVTSSTFLFRQLGGAVAIGIMGGVMSRGLTFRLSAFREASSQPHVLDSISGARDLVRPEIMEKFSVDTAAALKGILADSLSPVFLLVLAVMGVGLLLSLWFASGSGRPDGP